MQPFEILFKEENINIQDARDILDVYYSSKDENYKKWLMEITPFKDFHPHNSWFWRAYYVVLRLLVRVRLHRHLFLYNGVVFTIEQPKEDELFVKWSINGSSKVFFKIKKGTNIFIDKMISLEKWLWRKSIKELCKYYHIFDITVEPSIYAIWFWEKMKKEYRQVINISIQ